MTVMPTINDFINRFIVGIITYMSHQRNRFILPLLQKQAKFWPVVGLLGPRQSGKSTIFRDLMQLGLPVSLDELEARTEARNSPDVFLRKLASTTNPVIIDEVQKAPDLFDAIKLKVDKKKIPGSFFLTGSAGFSSKIGIRESLTGRIGICELLPMTLAELHSKTMPKSPQVTDLKTLVDGSKARFSLDEITPALFSGGMPVPAFLRDTFQRTQYWKSWLETAVLRDLAAFFPRAYDADFALSLMNRMAAVMREGELPTLRHFQWPALRVRNYLSAMREIFLVRQLNCHPSGIGKEAWIFMDAGLAAHLMGETNGEAITLTLARHFLWNEWAAHSLYSGHSLLREYYKSSRGSPVDAILDGVPFKIVSSVNDVTQRLKIEERALLGAMKKLDAKTGFLVAPVERATLPSKKGGVGILPWGFWS